MDGGFGGSLVGRLSWQVFCWIFVGPEHKMGRGWLVETMYNCCYVFIGVVVVWIILCV